MKRFASIMLVFAFMMLVSCGKTNLLDSKDKSGAEYSNLVDSTSQSELGKILLSCGIYQKQIDIFFEDLNEYNTTVENVTLVQSGYKSFDLFPVSYDEDKLGELWNEKYPVFMGYNCKLTAFFLYKNFIHSKSVVSEAENEMGMMFDLSPEKAQTHFSKDDRRLFNTLYQAVEIDSEMTQRKCVDKLKSSWNEYGIAFDETDKIKHITVWTEDDYPDYHLEPVHAGLLFYQNGKLCFLEKLSFVKPYQYSIFNNEKDLHTYLNNMFGKNKRLFIVMKNAQVIE